MLITFCGHSKLVFSEQDHTRLIDVLKDCIDKGVDTFYCGGYGAFDLACAYVVKELKEQYPHIKSFPINAYMTPRVKKELNYIRKCDVYDGSIYPELETVPLKFAISKRNEWMIEQSDIVIAYVDHDWGGAWTTLQYAKRKKKKIINIFAC